MTTVVAPRGHVVVHAHDEGEPCVGSSLGRQGCYVRPGLLARFRQWVRR